MGGGMKRNILKELLSDAYDDWYNDQLPGEAYKQFARLIMAKADELSESGVITDDEWSEIEEENMSNLMLVDDVAEL